MNEERLCPFCGSRLEESTAFCTECGHALEAEDSERRPEIQTTDSLQSTEAPAEAAGAPEGDGAEKPAAETSLIPGPETARLSRREARQKEKLEREIRKAQEKAELEAKKAREKSERLAEKQRLKDEKIAAKKAKRAARRAKNIWAIVLSVLLFAALCYSGYLLYSFYNENNSLTAELSEMTERNGQLEKEKKELETRLTGSASSLEETAGARDEAQKQAKELEAQLEEKAAELKQKGDELHRLERELDDLNESYDGILEALEYDNLGFSSEKLYADTGIVIMKKSARGYDVKITCEGQFSVECVSGDAASCSAEGYEITFTPEDYGVSVFEIGLGRSKSEAMNIIVIVK